MPINLVQSFLFELEKIYDLLRQNKSKQVINGWTKRSSNIGKLTTVVTSEGKIKGKATKIDTDGALVLTHGRHIHRVLVGDVI